jgi:hypothetical protein
METTVMMADPVNGREEKLRPDNEDSGRRAEGE